MSLVELVVAMVMTAAIGVMVMTLLRAESRASGHAADRAEALDATRAASVVLSADLGVLDPFADIHGLGPDSIALRVFRGTGIVCEFASGEPVLRYRGLRLPEPDKDSVLILSALHGERADSLQAIVPAPLACASMPGESLVRLRLATTVRLGDALLVFESGSYHLDASFRYRRGAGGRQPITADVFANTSGFAQLAAPASAVPHAIVIDLVPAPSTRTLRGTPLADRTRLRVPLRNAALR